MACYVYFIGTSAGVKIGVSCHPPSRMGGMQTGCPLVMEVLGSEFYPTQKRAEVREKELHEQFREDRIHGEWFLASEELAQVIGIPATVSVPPYGRFIRQIRAEAEETIRDIRTICDERLERYREKLREYGCREVFLKR